MFEILLNGACITISFAFPVVITYKALKTNNIQLLKPWIIYWLIYSSLCSFENFFNYPLSFIPFYPFIKLYICVWLVLPQTKGAEYLYFKHAEPFLAKHESDFENWLENFNIWDYVFYIKDRLIGATIPIATKSTNIDPLKNKPPQDVPKKSIIDTIMEKFSEQNASTEKSIGNMSIFDSLSGVISALPLSSYRHASFTNQEDKAKEVIQEIKEIADDIIPSKTGGLEGLGSTINDYDVVGREEFENFGKDLKQTTTEIEPSKETKVPTTSSSWLTGWFYSSNRGKME